MEEHGDFRSSSALRTSVLKIELINEFILTSRPSQMVECLDKDSFRRADLIRTLLEVHKTVYYSVEDIDRETFLAKLAEADTLLNAQLAKKNLRDNALCWADWPLPTWTRRGCGTRAKR